MTRIMQYEMTAGEWTSQNPVLRKGELGWESGVTVKGKKGDGVTAWNALPYWIDSAVSLKAPIASPVFTGNPQAPTPTAGDNDTSIATTAFVETRALATVIDSIADADLTHAPSRNAVFDALALKANLASPALTGNPTAPTPSPGDNDTSIATSAFVAAAIAAKILSGSGSLSFGAIAAQTATVTAFATQTITVTGAAVGDICEVGPPAAINAGLIWASWVSAANTVSIRLFNHTAGIITPTASSTWTARVIK